MHTQALSWVGVANLHPLLGSPPHRSHDSAEALQTIHLAFLGCSELFPTQQESDQVAGRAQEKAVGSYGPQKPTVGGPHRSLSGRSPWVGGFMRAARHKRLDRGQNTGGRVFKPFTKQILTLPQAAKEGRAPAPHSGSDVHKPRLGNCWSEGGRSRPSLLVTLGSGPADGVKASCTHPSGSSGWGSWVLRLTL